MMMISSLLALNMELNLGYVAMDVLWISLNHLVLEVLELHKIEELL